jgi:hypothetical protein
LTSDLAGDEYVVRAGEMNPEVVLKSILAHHDRHGVYGLSVAALPGAPIDEVLRAASFPHSVCRVSTVASIEAAGFSVVRDPEPGFESHALVVFPDVPSLAQAERLVSRFGRMIDNPYRRQRRVT